MIEQNANASQVHEAEVVLNLVFVAHDDTPEVLQPGIQSFSLPTTLVAPELAAILGGWLHPVGTMWRNDFDATLSQLRIQRVRVIRFVTNQAFGFIRDNSGQGYFFHRSSVQGSFDSLSEGQRVSFDEEQSPKGPRAGNVRAE